MKFQVLDHPLVQHKLTVLRDASTQSCVFRELVRELVMLAAYEATRDLPLESVQVTTPICPTMGKRLVDPQPLIIPILRAGLGMLDGMSLLLPTAEIGFLGMKRDEATLDILTYADRIPENISGRHCLLHDPMLATGGTLFAAIDHLAKKGARTITSINIIAAPEGVKRLETSVDPSIDLRVVTCALDERLNDKAYIVPGLGDAGDRLYGVVS